MGIEESFGQGGLNHLVDPDQLLDEIGLDEEEIDWRKEFVGFDEDDERRLSEMEGILRAHQEEIADRFYENLTRYDQTTEVIERSPKGVEQLKQTQRAYMVSLATGDYDREYFRNRARIGKLHDLIDMPLKHYVGQYGVYYDLLFTVLEERVRDQVVEAIREWTREEVESRDEGFGLTAVLGGLTGGDDDPEEIAAGLEATVENQIHEAVRDLLALLKILSLDMQVAADTYVHSYNQRLERQLDERERLAREVGEDLADPLSELDGTTDEIAESTQEIRDLAVTQSEEMTDTADEVAALSGTIQEIAATAEEVRTRTETATDRAEDGRRAAEDAADSMDEVTDSVRRLGEEMERLDDRLDAVDEVLEELNDLARRTNSISTRVAVQAAEADSPAFEAVAEEIESFATEAQEGMTRVETRIEEMRADVADAVEETEATVETVQESTEDVDTAVSALSEIADDVDEVADDVDEVAAATEDGADGAERVAEAVSNAADSAERVADEVDNVAAATQQQRSTVEEIARNARKLTDDAQVDREEEAVPPQ